MKNSRFYMTLSGKSILRNLIRQNDELKMTKNETCFSGKNNRNYWNCGV